MDTDGKAGGRMAELCGLQKRKKAVLWAYTFYQKVHGESCVIHDILEILHMEKGMPEVIEKYGEEENQSEKKKKGKDTDGPVDEAETVIHRTYPPPVWKKGKGRGMDFEDFMAVTGGWKVPVLCWTNDRGAVRDSRRRQGVDSDSCRRK